MFDGVAAEEDHHLLDVTMVTRPPLAGLLQRLREMLGAPVAVQTPSLVLLLGAGAIEEILLDPDASLDDRRAVSRAAQVTGAVGVPARIGRRARSVIAVRAAQDVLGYVVAGCSESAWTRTILARGAALIALVLLAGEEVHGDLGQRSDALFHDLLSGVGVHGLVARAATLGFDLRIPHRPLAFGFDPPALDREQLMSEVERLRRVVVEQGSRIRSWAPRSLAGIDTHGVIAFVPERATDTRDTLADRVVEIYRSYGLSVSAGIGDLCTQPGEYALGARRAIRALEVLRLNRRAGAVLSHDDLGVYGLLFSAEDASRLEAYVRKWIGRLIEHERGHPGELTRTLECVLDQPTLVEAGQAMAVHVSTLKYRLRRVEAVLGVNLRDPEVPFNLHLALKLHRIMTHLMPRSVA